MAAWPGHGRIMDVRMDVRMGSGGDSHFASSCDPSESSRMARIE